MASLSPNIERLVDALQILPSVGPKTAVRMALFLLHRNRSGAQTIVDCLSQALENVRQCNICRNFSDDEICTLCDSPHRDSDLLCVVESSADLVAIENTGGYSGKFYVLHGHLSPIDSVGPFELGLPELVAYVCERNIREVIIATNPTVEGEATGQYIRDALSNQDIAITRIAHGVPMGGELEYVDGNTLAHALRGRKSVI